MAVSKIGVSQFEMENFDGCNDYVLCERQVTSILSAMRLDKVYKPRPKYLDDDD